MNMQREVVILALTWDHLDHLESARAPLAESIKLDGRLQVVVQLGILLAQARLAVLVRCGRSVLLGLASDTRLWRRSGLLFRVVHDRHTLVGCTRQHSSSRSRTERMSKRNKTVHNQKSSRAPCLILNASGSSPPG
jgi:hypothetical protein